MEAFCVGIGFMVFLVQFYLRSYSPHAFYSALAIAFLGIGLLDLLHIIYSSGLPDLPAAHQKHSAIFFWQTARLLEALAFLSFAIGLKREIARPNQTQLIFLFVAGYIFLSAFLALAQPDLLPLFLFDDQGQSLAPLRAGIEVTFLITYVFVAVLLFRARSALDNSSFLGLITASLLIGIAGICVSAISHPQNSTALIGHMLRVVAYSFLSGVLVKSALTQPYLRLQALDESLRAQSDRLRISQRRVLQLERLSTLGKGVSSIVHDLNNMLMVATHSARKINQLLQAGKEVETSSISRHSNTILRSLAKTQNFQRLLLTESRPSGAEASASIGQLLDQMKPLLKAMCGEKINLVTDCNVEIEVAIDQVEIEHLLLLLAGHSIDAIADDPGTIVIQVRSMPVTDALQCHSGTIEPGRYLVLSVKHTGEAIKEEDLARLFDPPFATSQTSGASSLGLSSVMELVQNWGAGIQTDSKPGYGTEFRIFLPLPPLSKL